MSSFRVRKLDTGRVNLSVVLHVGGVDIHVDVPGAVIFDGDVLPVESVVLDAGEHPFLPLVSYVRKDDHAVLLSRLEQHDPSRVAIGDVPRARAGIVDAKRSPVLLVGMQCRGPGVKRRQDDHVLDRHALEDAREVPFAFSGARSVAVDVVQLPAADELSEVVVFLGRLSLLALLMRVCGKFCMG